MSNLFNEIVTDIDNVEQDILGPDYNYVSKIKSPSDLRMSSNGTIPALASNIVGIIDYVQLLISGGGASKTGQPLGDAFFLKTLGQCKDYKTGDLQTRYMYINNIPTKSIPIISNLTGINFPEFRGLAPGMLEDIYDMNPIKLFRAFAEGTEPLCANVSLQTIDDNNNSEMKNGFVPISELIDLENSTKIPSGTVSEEMKNALKNNVAENAKPVPTKVPEKTPTEESFINLSNSLHGIENKLLNYRRENKYKYNLIEKIYFYGLIILLTVFIYKMYKK